MRKQNIVKKIFLYDDDEFLSTPVNNTIRVRVALNSNIFYFRLYMTMDKENYLSIPFSQELQEYITTQKEKLSHKNYQYTTLIIKLWLETYNAFLSNDEENLNVNEFVENLKVEDFSKVQKN